jgi:hypothetical protein
MLRKQQDQDELARDGWGSAAGDGSRTRTSSRVMDGDRPQATAAEEDVLTRMDAAEAAGRTTATLLARSRDGWGSAQTAVAEDVLTRMRRNRGSNRTNDGALLARGQRRRRRRRRRAN